MSREGCKLVIIGDSGVGKTSIVKRFVDNEFEPSFVATIGIDFKIKTIGGTRIKIWDTAGQEQFKAITSAYYRGAKGIIFVYDVTNKESFEHIGSVWLPEVKKFTDDSETIFMLVGNKIDLGPAKVSIQEAEIFAKSNNMITYETSAKERNSVNVCFTELIKIIEKKSEKKDINNDNNITTTIVTEENQIKQGCC